MHPFIHLGENLAIPTYGLLYMTAFLASIAGMGWLGSTIGIPFWKMVDYSFQYCIAGEIGARVAFVIVEWDSFMAGSISLYRFLVAGRVVLGGVLGGLVYAVWLFRRHRLPLLAVMDASVAPVPIGMGIGRLGCLMSGCCYGKPTDLWWGITFTNPDAHRISGTPLNVPLHPTQILQAIDGFVVAGILIWVFFRRRWDGQVAALFFALTGLIRFGWETLRGDRRGAAAGLATSQWIGLVMILLGTVMFFWTRKRGTLSTYTPPA